MVHCTQVLASAQGIANLTSSEILIGGVEVIHRMEKQWRELCDEATTDPFMRPEWVAAHVRAFEPKSDVIIIRTRVGDRLTGVLPLIRKRSLFAGTPVLKLVAAANCHSARFDILRAPGFIGEGATEAIWSLLKRRLQWHLIEMPVFTAESSCQQIMSLATQEGYHTVTGIHRESPFMTMQTDASGRLNWQAETTRHFRHELRRFARILETEAGGVPRLISTDRPDPDLLRRFFELEASGWKGNEGSAINCNAATRGFYAEIARISANCGQFCMHSLEVNGKMLAGAFGIFGKDCYYPLKIAYDESFRRGGPGQLMMNGILEECAQRGIPQVDFGGNQDRYKTSWTLAARRHFSGLIFNCDSYPVFLYRFRGELLPALRRKYASIRDKFLFRDRTPTVAVPPR